MLNPHQPTPGRAGGVQISCVEVYQFEQMILAAMTGLDETMTMLQWALELLQSALIVAEFPLTVARELVQRLPQNPLDLGDLFWICGLNGELGQCLPFGLLLNEELHDHGTSSLLLSPSEWSSLTAATAGRQPGPWLHNISTDGLGVEPWCA